MAIATLGSMVEGSIIKPNEDGAPVEFYVAKQDYEPELNGTGRVLVIRKNYNIYDDGPYRAWHTTSGDDGDTNYATSFVDSWMNGEYKNRLDDEIQEAMGTTKIYCTFADDPYNTMVGILERSVFLLSGTEHGFSHELMNVEGTPLPKTEALNSTLVQWTRSPINKGDSHAWNVQTDRKISCDIITHGSGVRPAFTLPSSCSVRDDGSVFRNTEPDAPPSITVSEEVLGGTSLTVTWSAASDVNDNLTGYELERQVDGGEWTQIYKGEATSYTDTITRGWLTVSYRVRAYDSLGLYSDYITSPTREVNNNRAPSITCGTASGADLDVKSEGFTIPYSAADADGDPVTITEAIDGTVLRTFTPEADAPCAFSVTGETFMKLLNGAHTLTITASDGQAQAVHTLGFTKSVTAACVTLAQPIEADGPITLCVLSVTGSIPEDASYSVKVTNNGRDAAPVWEDCTDEVKLGANHVFTNETAANGFAFNFKVEVERGENGQGGCINSVQGGFE